MHPTFPSADLNSVTHSGSIFPIIPPFLLYFFPFIAFRASSYSHLLSKQMQELNMQVVKGLLVWRGQWYACSRMLMCGTCAAVP